MQDTESWIPACAGMTRRRKRGTEGGDGRRITDTVSSGATATGYRMRL